MAKVDATRNYGAQVELAGAGFDESMAAAQEHVESIGATFVHAFEDERVIAGQGTIGLELAEQLPDIGNARGPDRRRRAGSRDRDRAQGASARTVRLVGVQAENMCPLAGGTEHRYTIAEGIAVKQPGTLTSAILADSLDDVVTVSDDQISHAIVLLLERTKLLVEGAGAASVAAVLAGKAGGDDEACVLLSGGNIDATLLIEVMRHGLTQAGRFLVVRTRLGDRPGELIKLLQLVAEERANVVSVEHHREGMRAPDRPDRGRAHARDARRGALRRAPRHPRRAAATRPRSSASREGSASPERLVFLKHKPPRRPVRPGRRAAGRGCSRSSGRGLRRPCSRLP